jgi:hypothetical protein
MTDERLVTACHEAGHAVAALMRGSGELRSITIEPTPDHLGYTGFRGKPCDMAFVTYAGPWSEARAQWPMPTIDGRDDDELTFDDYLSGAWLRNASGDGVDYRRAQNADNALFGAQFADLSRVREEAWHSELESRWPVIRELAEMLLSGPVDAETAANLVDRQQWS